MPYRMQIDTLAHGRGAITIDDASSDEDAARAEALARLDDILWEYRGIPDDAALTITVTPER